MHSDTRKPPFLIIGGAEKAGTTAVFSYLAAHPQACPSRTKETDFFRREDRYAQYLHEFDETAGDAVRVESSPAYLAEAQVVAPRIAAAVPHARLVFVLRDPIDRLRSAFRFYKSRLHVPQDMRFEEFVRACQRYEREGATGDRDGMRGWHLRALDRGRYDLLLPAFETRFDAEQILLVHHERLRSDPAGVMQDIACHAGLNPAPFVERTYERENVSFLARNIVLQRVAIRVNDGLEALWRRRPMLKRRLVDWYKRLNERALERDELPTDLRAELAQYYAGARARLEVLPRGGAKPAI